LDKLIQGCTTTGAAHQELRKYLMVYMPTVKKLSTSGQREDLVQVKAWLTVCYISNRSAA
jgi:hypothetical protein